MPRRCPPPGRSPSTDARPRSAQTPRLLEAHPLAPTSFGTTGVPARDVQTVQPTGEAVARRIDGVVIKPLVTHVDERGSVCELYHPDWAYHADPLVYVEYVTIRPGKIKGWVVHEQQDDRGVVGYGTIQVALYDGRAGSPTFGLVNEFCFSEANRALFTVPQGVWHAVRNVGVTDALFINMPTRAYDHAAPDKHRLPVDTDAIPYVWR